MTIVKTFGGVKIFFQQEDLKKCYREIPWRDVTLEHFYKKCQNAYSDALFPKFCAFNDMNGNSKILSPIEKEEPRKIGRYFIK